MTPAQLLDAHPGARLLTVDFFDTLVTRSVAQPTHVFALMERELTRRDPGKWHGFARQRVLAERRARQVAAGISEHSDVSIEDITRELAAELGLDPEHRFEIDMGSVRGAMGIADEIDSLTYADVKARRDLISQRMQGRRRRQSE